MDINCRALANSHNHKVGQKRIPILNQKGKNTVTVAIFKVKQKS